MVIFLNNRNIELGEMNKEFDVKDFIRIKFKKEVFFFLMPAFYWQYNS
jgi:hypothetical protein